MKKLRIFQRLSQLRDTKDQYQEEQNSHIVTLYSYFDDIDNEKTDKKDKFSNIFIEPNHKDDT